MKIQFYYLVIVFLLLSPLTALADKDKPTIDDQQENTDVLIDERPNIDDEYRELLERHIEITDDPGIMAKFHQHWEADNWRESGGYYFWIEPYIVEDYEYDLYPFFRLDASYYGDDWIFMDNVRFVIDGEAFYMEFDSYDVDSDVWDGGLVYESVDLPDYEHLIRSIAEADEVIMVIMGRHHRVSYEFNDTVFVIFKEIVDYYDYILAPEFEQERINRKQNQ